MRLAPEFLYSRTYAQLFGELRSKLADFVAEEAVDPLLQQVGDAYVYVELRVSDLDVDNDRGR